MKIVLATGIYPPDIGGPATYVQNLARVLVGRGHAVVVLAYGDRKAEASDMDGGYSIIRVSRAGGSIGRWQRFAAALKKHGEDADVIYAFSSVSCGIPLRMSGLKKPKKILRLGGDFLWERYTDRGGRRTLRAFYLFYRFMRWIQRWLLRSFDFVVFSTPFQERLYEFLIKKLPPHGVVENALPQGEAVLHTRHEPFRLLFMGRFVRFKNIAALLKSISLVPHVRLTLIGEGPLRANIKVLLSKLGIEGRVTLLTPVHGEEKVKALAEHDLLVLPSITEISPNVAMEARSVGLPVLLTDETGLGPAFTEGMEMKKLRTSQDITKAILEAERGYEALAEKAAKPVAARWGWEEVGEETEKLFEKLVVGSL